MLPEWIPAFEAHERQILAVKRERIPRNPTKEPGTEIGYYAESLTRNQMSSKDLLKVIQEHWSAIENGVHSRWDVSFEEDKCRVKNRQTAETLTVLRNLTIGHYELKQDRGKTPAARLKTWIKRQPFRTAHSLLKS